VLQLEEPLGGRKMLPLVIPKEFTPTRFLRIINVRIESWCVGEKKVVPTPGVGGVGPPNPPWKFIQNSNGVGAWLLELDLVCFFPPQDCGGTFSFSSLERTGGGRGKSWSTQRVLPLLGRGEWLFGDGISILLCTDDLRGNGANG